MNSKKQLKNSKHTRVHRQNSEKSFFSTHHKHMNQKKVVIVTTVVLVFITIYMVIDYVQRKESVSSHILSLTQPVTTISGIVDAVGENQITIKQVQSYEQSLQPPATNTNVLLSPTPKTDAFTYQVIVSDKTKLHQAASFEYLFKTVPTMQKLSIKDIKVGQYITVSSKVDLRTIGNVFEAATIDLPQKMNSISGTIIRLDGNTLILKALLPTSPTQQEKQFTITITNDTEISHKPVNALMVPDLSNLPKPEKLSISDLKEGMQVIIYTDVDVLASNQLTALRIDPTINVPAPVMNTSASGAAQIVSPTP